MLIAGLMAISDFPLATQMLADLASRVDILCIRFDTITGAQAIWHRCLSAIAFQDRVYVLRSKKPWNRWNWREDLIRMLDNIKPDFVLFPDSDETFGPDFEDDFLVFQNSGWDMMMFDYEMITEDNRLVRKYPGARHCKAFRWQPGITYIPYTGYARPNFPDGANGLRQGRGFHAQSRIQHYCFFTRKMESNKILHK